MAVKVALAGATGNLGPYILRALLDAGFEVTVLSRQGSTSTNSLPPHSNQKVVGVNYNDVDDLTSALKGVDVVVSTVGSEAIENKEPLIDAAVAAGVKRYLPSEFGSDLQNPLNQKLPVFQAKVRTAEYLENIVKSNPNFSYTLARNNAFFDWCLNAGVIAKPKEHKINLFDGGDVRFSTTRLSTVGKAVVGIINNLDATKNRAVYYHDVAVTQNQLLDHFKKIDGKEWMIEEVATADSEKEGYELLNNGGNVGQAMINFIYRAAFGKDHEPDFSGKLDNELLGLKEMSHEEVSEFLKTFL